MRENLSNMTLPLMILLLVSLTCRFNMPVFTNLSAYRLTAMHIVLTRCAFLLSRARRYLFSPQNVYLSPRAVRVTCYRGW
jgi:hypothetical protein